LVVIMKGLFCSIFFLTVSVACFAAPGDLVYPHSLKSVSGGGKSITLEDHSLWKVSEGKAIAKLWSKGDSIRVSPVLGPNEVKHWVFKNLATNNQIVAKISDLPDTKRVVKVKSVRADGSVLYLDNEEIFDCSSPFNRQQPFFLWHRGDPVFLFDLDEENASRGVYNLQNGRIVWMSKRLTERTQKLCSYAGLGRNKSPKSTISAKNSLSKSSSVTPLT